MSLDAHHPAAPKPPQDGLHPPVQSIEDVITFRLHRLITMAERGGNNWPEAQFGLSLNEWRLLALVKARTPVRAGDVAELLMMDKSQMSRLIKGLIARRLLRNAPDARDARAAALTLTPQGQTLHDRMLAEVLRGNEKLLAVLTPDQVDALYEMLSILITHSEALLAARING
tara:strand:- start:58020 stop:58535 length:516 start_codon:yes stop_codon:yes gene_type:complete